MSHIGRGPACDRLSTRHNGLSCRCRTSDKSVLHAYAAQPDGAVEEGLAAEDVLTAGKEQVWMSHGDEAAHLPAGFEAVATSEQVPRVLIAE